MVAWHPFTGNRLRLVCVVNRYSICLRGLHQSTNCCNRVVENVPFRETDFHRSTRDRNGAFSTGVNGPGWE